LSADVSAAVRTAPAFAPADERDVSESVDYTFDALQQRFERGTRAYHELLMRVLDATNPALAIDVRDHLANVPSAALRTLFSGSLADRDMAAERRYLLMLLGRES
jgi:hypothetical protein